MTKKGTHHKNGVTGQISGKPVESSEKDKPQEMAAMDAEAGHIDKIRDIIFGRQMADYEKRFAQLENRITSQIDTLREETDERIKALKDLFQRQNETFTERLKDEQTRRGRDGKAISMELAKVEKSLLKSIDALSAQQIQDVQSLGDQLSALSGELSDELHINQVEASKNLEQAFQELDDAKLARRALSQILMEMAGRLSGEQN